MQLIGTEQVQNAARSMKEAAGEMNAAASRFEYVMQEHQRFMNDWLQRLEDALKRVV